MLVDICIYPCVKSTCKSAATQVANSIEAIKNAGQSVNTSHCAHFKDMDWKEDPEFIRETMIPFSDQRSVDGHRGNVAFRSYGKQKIHPGYGRRGHRTI